MGQAHPVVTAAAPSDDESGFTLVEVLVAFAIIALTLTTALRVLADGTGWARRGPREAARVEEAVSLMNMRIADPRLGTANGTFADGSRWRIRATDVTSLLLPVSRGRLVRIELLVEGRDKPLFVTLAGDLAR